MPGRKLYILLASSFTGVLILLGLGFWQLERLEWKQALLTNLERALSKDAPVLSLLRAEDIMQRDPSQDYLRLKLEGTFDHANERYLFSVLDGEPGWQVITPLITKDRRVVLINRGFVPDALKAPQERSDSLIQGETEIHGLLRKPPRPGLFTPANQPDENIWYWPDVPAMIAALNGEPGLEQSSYIVQVLPLANASPWPKALPRQPAAIPNNHLQYALTWFALGFILAVMTFMLVRRVGKGTGRPGTSI